LAERDLDTIAQQKNPRSSIVQALKSIDPHHPAIELIALTTEQYQELNDKQQLIATERGTTFISNAHLDPLVYRAADLLDSLNWSEIAAGIAILAGRRISEILLSDFSLSSDWVQKYSTQSKKI
jgi:hypothetical protein